MHTAYIVLQNGKVGSWTIIKTLQAAQPDIRLCNLDEVRPDQDSIVHTHSAPDVRAWLPRRPDGIRLVFINAVRDPLRSCVSMFFQNFADPFHKTSKRQHLYVGTQDEILSMPVEHLIRHFQERVTEPTPWRTELFTVTFGQIVGAEPYLMQFDEHGIASGPCKGGAFHVLRVHRFGDALPELGRRLGLNVVDIHDGNVSDEKWYGPKYREFLRAYRPTERELAMFYDAPFARSHFTREELATFRSAWAAT